MADMSKIGSMLFFERSYWEWTVSIVMLLVTLGILIGICWWIPTIVGYPFYLVYSRAFGWALNPAESFWATFALSFFVWLLSWLLRQIRNLFD